MKVLIFGGLNPIGGALTSHFLDQGFETSVVKAQDRSEEEDDIELFFGRNALYSSLDYDFEQRDADRSYNIIWIANYLFQFDETAIKSSKEHFKNLSKEKPLSDYVVLLSVIDEESNAPLDQEKPEESWNEEAEVAEVAEVAEEVLEESNLSIESTLYSELENSFRSEYNQNPSKKKWIVIRMSKNCVLEASPFAFNCRKPNNLITCIQSITNLDLNEGFYVFEVAGDLNNNQSLYLKKVDI